MFEIGIKKAIISVFDKTGLADLALQLHDGGTVIYSTGGTQRYLESIGIPVNSIESITGFPEMLGGRVKTLHPHVFGGILAQRQQMSDLNDLASKDIPLFDLVIVDLYPFCETLKETRIVDTLIEKIDIGGISLIRAAAKNHKDVAVVSNKIQYKKVTTWLANQANALTLLQRKSLATEAFFYTSQYDSSIFNWLNEEHQKPMLSITQEDGFTLRYGENPHQKANFYGDLNNVFTNLSGKTLSYNNMLDVEAALRLMSEFSETTFAILKHNNPCGLATRNTVFEAWKAALSGDPVSAFGGILITNGNIDYATALDIDHIFYEVLIAPKFDEDALALLKKRPKRILLQQHSNLSKGIQYRSLLGGFIAQELDIAQASTADLKLVTNTEPEENKFADLIFANKIVKHTKSNAIVLAKNKQLIGAGTGQTSRVDSLKQAIAKAKAYHFDPKDAVLASDAFFPFADCVEIAYNEGINHIIQPGGSIKDQDSIDFCNNHKMCMVFTGIRHFKH